MLNNTAVQGHLVGDPSWGRPPRGIDVCKFTVALVRKSTRRQEESLSCLYGLFRDGKDGRQLLQKGARRSWLKASFRRTSGRRTSEAFKRQAFLLTGCILRKEGRF